MRQRDQELLKQIDEIKQQQTLLEQQRQQSKEARIRHKAHAERPKIDEQQQNELNLAALRRSSTMNSQTSSRQHDVVLDHPKVMSSSKHPIYRVCLTGGPCAGKTTAMTTITDHLTQKGFKVLIVPEAATMMNKGGCFI